METMCRLRALWRVVGYLAATLGVLGCGEETQPDELEAMPSGTSCGEPIHAIATSVSTGDDSASMYLTTVCGLEQDLTLDDAVEVPGGGRMYVYQDRGMIVLHSFETNELTRLDVAKDGKITVGPRLGLSGYGAVFAN